MRQLLRRLRLGRAIRSVIALSSHTDRVPMTQDIRAYPAAAVSRRLHEFFRPDDRERR